MEVKHTPGPWKANGAEVWGTHAIRFSLTTGGTPMIATVCKHEDAERAFPYDANARLIAAAPDLLESAIQILHNFPTDCDLIEAGWGPLEIEQAMQAHDNARAVIAKATGKT